MLLLAEPVPVCAQDPVVGADRDPPSAPRRPLRTTAVAERRRALLVIVVPTAAARVVDVLAKDAPQQPAPAHIVGVDDAAAAELDALAGVVYPGKVDVQGGLDQAEDDLDGLGLDILHVELARQPVKDVEPAVQAQREQVVAVDDGGHGRLAEEEELREDADGLEDVREVPEPLRHGVVNVLVSAARSGREKKGASR